MPAPEFRIFRGVKIMQLNTEELIGSFFSNVVEAASLLHSNNLYGHLMVIIYSSIDTMGLLDASPSQAKATNKTFKDWVKKYILIDSNSLDFNEVDLWAARCAVLHTFTSHSDLSDAGKAKQIQYYAGPKDTPMAQAFLTTTKQIDNGVHVPVHVGDIYQAFLYSLVKFAKDLFASCQQNPAYETRLRNILQQFAV